MGKYFGTDGFRGEANKDLTVEHAYKVGRYIGWYFGRNKDHVLLASFSGLLRLLVTSSWASIS